MCLPIGIFHGIIIFHLYTINLKKTITGVV